MTTNTLRINQKLKIPRYEENNEGINNDTYIVKSGDTLYSISKKYGISVDNLIDYNNLTNNSISIGQVLNLSPSSVNENDIEYVVKKGDNLYSIGKRYNITQQDIMMYNNLSNNLLSIGQILKIPVENQTNIYIVKKGDTLYSIARQFNTTVDNIKTKNNLTTNTLSVGKQLII